VSKEKKGKRKLEQSSALEKVKDFLQFTEQSSETSQDDAELCPPGESYADSKETTAFIPAVKPRSVFSMKYRNETEH